MQPLSGNQRPDLLTSLMKMSLVLLLPREIHLCRSSAIVSRLPSFLEMLQNRHVLLTFGRVQTPLRLLHKTTLQPPKVARTCAALCILTSKRASRHNSVHFLNISTAKSALNAVCFVHFDFEMCFAPQQRTLFEHLNFQKCTERGVLCTFWRALLRHLNDFEKWSEHGVFCTFWLPNMLRATAACNFSSLIWPDGSAPAALASLLVDPPEPQITLEKQSVSRLFYLFAHLHLLSSDSFSSLIFSLLLFSSLLWLCPPLLFHLSILSEVWLLNFLR